MVQERESFVKLHEAPFARRGSYFVFFSGDLAEQTFGMGELWLGTQRGVASTMERNKLMKVSPVWHGEKIPYAITTTPYELIIDTDHGTIRACIAENGLIRFHGEGEVGLELYSDMFRTGDLHENARDMYDGSWMVFYAMISNWLLVPVQGTMQMDAPWDWRLTMSKYVCATFSPDENNILEVAVEEMVDREGFRRAEYPAYEDCVKAVQEDFDGFVNKIPEFKNPTYEAWRKKAAWTSWSHLLSPSRVIKRPMMMMMHIYMAHCSGWQQATHAACLSDDMDLSYQLLRCMYDYQAEDGQLADVVSEFWAQMKAGKPPYQGFAILWLMKHRDFEGAFGKERIEELYGLICEQVRWWFEHRVMPGKVLPFYGNPDESGWDDATVYMKSCQMITPDIVTYLILLTEALSEMAKIIGNEEGQKKWAAKSQQMLDEMLEKMWDGERFNPLFPDTEEPFKNLSACSYQPLLLGKRLPQEVIDKMAADLSVEGQYLTPYGVASERLDSPYVEVLTGWVTGPIIAPLQLQLIVGLDECGKKELSQLIARRYCDALAKTGMYHICNPFNGEGASKGRDGVLHQHWTSWCSSIFLMLAEHYT